MADIVTLIRNKPDFYVLQGATGIEIERAEQILDTCFSDEYRSYVSAFGVASFAGHELTGVCKPKRLNVVEVTLEQRTLNQKIPGDWYVVEEAHIDGIVIWQSPSGEIYQAVADMPGRKIYGTLAEYVTAI